MTNCIIIIYIYIYIPPFVDVAQQTALATACEQHGHKVRNFPRERLILAVVTPSINFPSRVSFPQSCDGFAFRHKTKIVEGSSCPLRLSGLSKNVLVDLCLSQHSGGACAQFIQAVRVHNSWHEAIYQQTCDFLSRCKSGIGSCHDQ